MPLLLNVTLYRWGSKCTNRWRLFSAKKWNRWPLPIWKIRMCLENAGSHLWRCPRPVSFSTQYWCSPINAPVTEWIRPLRRPGGASVILRLRQGARTPHSHDSQSRRVCVTSAQAGAWRKRHASGAICWGTGHPAQSVRHIYCILSCCPAVTGPKDRSELLSESKDLISLTALKVTLCLTVDSTRARLYCVLCVQRWKKRLHNATASPLSTRSATCYFLQVTAQGIKWLFHCFLLFSYFRPLPL